MLVHHPWRSMRDLPEWRVFFTDQLPAHVRGVTRWSDRTVWVSIGLSQAERRAVIEHERQHILRGPGGRLDREEAVVRSMTARQMIPLPALVDALRWAPEDMAAVADELWCPVRVVRDRLADLSIVERRMIAALLDA